jgi:hypothetical protein
MKTRETVRILCKYCVVVATSCTISFFVSKTSSASEQSDSRAARPAVAASIAEGSGTMDFKGAGGPQ